MLPINESSNEKKGITDHFQNQLGDLQDINLEHFKANIWPEDNFASQQINAAFVRNKPNAVYIINGAAPHLLPSVNFAKKSGFKTHIVLLASLKDHHSSEQRTAGVIKGLGYEKVQDFIKDISFPDEEKK